VSPRTDDLTETLYSAKSTSGQPAAASSAAPINFPGLEELELELESLPKVSNFQLRFEEPYKDAIKAAASEAGVTPETLLQAVWVVVQRRPGLMTEAIAEAHEHHQRRDRAAELKNSITRLRKLLQWHRNA
jgi:hypothetical protein